MAGPFFLWTINSTLGKVISPPGVSWAEICVCSDLVAAGTAAVAVWGLRASTLVEIIMVRTGVDRLFVEDFMGVLDFPILALRLEPFGARLVWGAHLPAAFAAVLLLDSMPREPWYDFELGLEHGGQMKPGDMFRDLWWLNYCICCGTGCGRCDKPICGHSSFTACCKCVCELTYPLNPACHQVYLSMLLLATDM